MAKGDEEARTASDQSRKEVNNMQKTNGNAWVKLISMCLLVLILLTAGCTGPTAAPPTAALPTAAPPTPAPKPSGSLTIGVRNLGEEGFLPDIGMSGQSPLWRVVYDQLIWWDSKTEKPIPGLALSWEESKDFLTVTVKLRKGVPFHDMQGKTVGEVTAKDVKYTIERIMRPTSTNTNSSIFRDAIKSIEIIDDYTLVFNLKAPDAFFWLTFTIPQNPFLPILSKEYVEAVGEDAARSKPVGSGPYRLVEYRPSQYAKFEAFDEHWRVVPEFKELTLRIVPEETSLVAMLKTGEVDLANVTAKSLPTLAGTQIRILEWSKGAAPIAFYGGGMQLPADSRYVKAVSRTDPWVDVRVREALNLAIDRNAIVKSIYSGHATPIKIWNDWPGADDLPPIPYDPGRAKQLLAEAGYKDGFKFKIARYASSGAPEMLSIVDAAAGYWEAIGLKPEIVNIAEATFNPMRKAGTTNGYIYPTRSGYALDNTYRVAMFRIPEATYTDFQDERITEAGKVALDTTDWDKRVEAMKVMTTLERELWATIPIVKQNVLWAASQKVGDYPEYGRGDQWNFEYIRQSKPLNTWRLFTP